MEHVTKQEQKRFDKCWRKSGDCKLWINALDRDGYGSFYFRKRGRRAHRVAYFIANGDIPDGMVIDHRCRNRHCVEHSHLRCVTASQNSLENSNSVAAINRRKTTCKRGHPFDRFYGKQRSCSICQAAKTKRLRKKWREEARRTKC